MLSDAFVLVLLALASPATASSVWTVNCNPLTVQRSDPILSPGTASGHVHAVVGGTAFQRNMSTTNAAVQSKNTTCDKYTDHSNYWVPQLYRKYGSGNNNFTLLPFLGAGMYYTNYTCDYDPKSTNGYCPTIRQARAFPPGFRMIAGNSTRRTVDNNDEAQTALRFTTGSSNDVVGLPFNIGTRLQGNVRYPSCWDGVNVDSPTHNTHVAYPSIALGGNNQGGMCPSTHPYALIAIGGEFSFDTSSVANASELVFANGDTTGYGFHGDFLQGWTNLTALQQSFANCFDNNNCPWRAFGTPDGKDGQPTNFNPEVPAVYEEDIGLKGNPITALPGNNTVWTGAVPWATATSTASASH